MGTSRCFKARNRRRAFLKRHTGLTKSCTTLREMIASKRNIGDRSNERVLGGCGIQPPTSDLSLASGLALAAACLLEPAGRNTRPVPATCPQRGRSGLRAFTDTASSYHGRTQWVNPTAGFKGDRSKRKCLRRRPRNCLKMIARVTGRIGGPVEGTAMGRGRDCVPRAGRGRPRGRGRRRQGREVRLRIADRHCARSGPALEKFGGVLLRARHFVSQEPERFASRICGRADCERPTAPLDQRSSKPLDHSCACSRSFAQGAGNGIRRRNDCPGSLHR